MEKTVKIFRSFDEQEAYEQEYWKKLPGDQKLEILEAIRGNYWAMKNDTPRRLQRVYRIIKRSSS